MTRLVAAALGANLALAAAAQVPEELVNAQMRTGWRLSGGSHMAALDLSLAEGWKTYWRTPGEAGLPPRFDWSGSENLASSEVHWPRPMIFDQNGMRSIGYGDGLVLPIEFTPMDPTRPIRLHGTMDIGVCDDVCVPISLTVQADLPPKGGMDPVIAEALSDQPRPARDLNLRSLRCEVEPIPDGLRLTARMDMPALGPQEAVVIELADAGVWVSQTTVQREGMHLSASADLVPPDAAPFALDRSDLRLTLIGTGVAYELSGCPG